MMARTDVNTLLLKIGFLVLVVVLYFFARSLFLLQADRYQSRVAGNEIYRSIAKSRTKVSGISKLVLGDSAANQLYNNSRYNDSIYSLTCNQAISMAGYYLLLKNFLETNPELHDLEIYLIYHPKSFKNNLDQIYTFHYFLKPFNTAEYRPLFSATVLKQIEKMPFNRYAQLFFIKTNNWAPPYGLTDNKHDIHLSDISREYLMKIIDLSGSYGHTFKLLPPLVSRNFREPIEKFRSQISGSDILAEHLGPYLEQIVYWDDSLFSDGIHLKHPGKLGENPLKL